jgi:hypothetical protein
MVNFCVRIDKEILWKIVMCCDFIRHSLERRERSHVLLCIIRISPAKLRGEGDFKSYSGSRFAGFLYCHVGELENFMDKEE